MTRALLGQELFDLLGEAGATHFGGTDETFLVHQPRGGNRIDPVTSTDIVAPSLAVEVLRPRHASALGEADQLVLALIEGDADDLKAILVKLVVCGDHVR